MIEQYERKDFFEAVQDEVALSRWLRRRIDDLKKLARDLEGAEEYMLDAILATESDDGSQQQLPGVEKISPAERGIDRLRIMTRKCRDEIKGAVNPPDFAKERVEAATRRLVESVQAGGGSMEIRSNGKGVRIDGGGVTKI